MIAADSPASAARATRPARKANAWTCSAKYRCSGYVRPRKNSPTIAANTAKSAKIIRGRLRSIARS